MTTYDTSVITPEPGTDPDELHTRFRVLRQRIDDEINRYNPGDRVEDPYECADHHDQLEELYSAATDAMTALDDHLTAGGRPPAAWATAYTTR